MAEPPVPAATLRQGPFLAGLFAATAVTLALEVLLTRVLSVLTWYSLAFLVIGMGLFGLTAGAVRVYLRPERYAPERLAAQLARDALTLAVAIPASYAALLVVPLRVEPVATTVVLFAAFTVLLAIPFVAAGAVVAASLTRAPFPIGRVYAVDLAGAAVGAPAVPLLLEGLDAGSAIVLAGGVAALSSAAYATSGGDRRGVRRGLAVAAALGLLAIVNARTTHGLVPLWVKGHAEDRSHLAFETWNSHSRVQVSDESTGPAVMWGIGRCPPTDVHQRWITIDGDAGTVLYRADPDVDALGFLACDVTNVVHQLRPHGPMAIIGVGGSRDVQAAVMFGHEPVVGVELNQRLLDVLHGPLGAPTRIADRPGVRLVHDDGRSFMARTHEKFRVIQMSLIDTWAATGAGAHALGENGLYTVEGWKTFLSRLEPDGVFTVSRWFTGGARDETARLVSLATGTLLEMGVERPRAHLALVASGPVATLLVSRSPMTAEDVKKLGEARKKFGFEILEAPGEPDGIEELAPILDAKSRAALDRVALHPALDLRPPTDERPFFFNLLRVRAWLAELPMDEGGTIEGNRRATGALVLAFLVSLALVAVAIVLPLWLHAPKRGLGARGPEPGEGVSTASPIGRRARPPDDRALYAALAYFALIGVGFMLAEIGLLQRLSVVLGHPLYSLVVVLASLVGAAGVGSLLSDRLPLDRAPACYLFPLAIAALLVALSLLLPRYAPAVQPAELPVRIGFALAVTAALGLVLGLAFPAGMRIFRGALADETPWLWGINGIGGVLASSGGIIVALEWGLDWLFVSAAIAYALLVVAIAVGRRAVGSLSA